MATAIAGAVRTLVQRAWRATMVRSAGAVLLGIVALLTPSTTALVAALAFGVYALGDGLINVSEALLEPPHSSRMPRIATGLFVAVVGSVVLIWPRTALAVGVIVFAIGLIGFGLLQIMTGLATLRIAGSGAGWAIVAGVLAMLFGALVIARPEAGLTSIVWVVGAWSILWGLAWCGLLARIRWSGRTKIPV